jgi:hypothetical protein
MKKIYVLVGPPSVGKSTWIKNTFVSTRPYVINRDDLAEQVAQEYGWTYDDMFVYPPSESVIGDKSEKYGEVISAPAYMTWPGAPKVVYDGVQQANAKVQSLFTERVSGAVGQDNIVVDMTNMNAGARKGALKAIEGREEDYYKIAVVFNFQGAEEIIKKVAKKRAEEAKKMGKSKTIGPDVFDRMFKSYQKISPEEGFDEVVEQDNTSKLKELINERFRYIKTYDNF